MGRHAPLLPLVVVTLALSTATSVSALQADRIVFVGGSETDPSDLFVIDADGSAREQILGDMSAETPAWSPSRSRIVFAGWSGTSWDLYLVRPDGTGLRHLTNAPREEGGPSWAPNGKHLAYYKGKTIWVIRPDGTHDHQVSPFGTAAQFPSWSPDGASIAVQTRDGIASMQSTANRIYMMRQQPSEESGVSADGHTRRSRRCQPSRATR